MPIRNRHKLGDYLMRDDESGEVRYRSQLKKRWDNVWVQEKGWETRQPQEFVRAGTDPHTPNAIRPEEDVPVPFNALGVFIGGTSVPVPTNNAAAHLFDPGIGQMKIGVSFFVR